MARTRRGVSRLLERVGIRSPFLQHALPPVVIAVVIIAVAWAFGVAPDTGAIGLLVICYVLYLLPRRIRRYALPLTILALAIVYPFLVQQVNYQRFLFTIPVFNNFPSIDTMVLVAVFAMMAVGLNMVVGYAGLLDLGYVAFYALGAYTAAWLASPHAEPIGGNFVLGGVGIPEGVGGIHISIWIVLLAAAIVTALGGIVIGLPTLRLRGDYLAIVTLGFGEIVAEVARNGDKETLGFDLTSGPPGINPIDPPGFGVWLQTHLGLPANFLEKSGTYINFTSLFYWSALGLLLITIFCSIRLRDSRLGRAWIAIREDEVAAAAMGIPLMRTKTWAYASGAFFGGVAGAWYGSFKQGVFPDDFYFGISIFILSMVILGGMGNVWGVVAGAAFLTYLNFEGLANISQWFNTHVLPCDAISQDPGKVVSGGCINAPLVSTGIYGLIIVAVMLLRPEGIIPERRRQLEFETGVHDEPLMDVRHAAEE